MLRKGNPLPFLEKVIVSGHLWKKFLGGKIQERFYLKDGDRSTNTNNRKKIFKQDQSNGARLYEKNVIKEGIA